MRMWWTNLRQAGVDDAQSEFACTAGARCAVTTVVQHCTVERAAQDGAGQCAGRASQHRDQTTDLMDTDLQRLALACNKAAEHYCAHPDEIGAGTVVEIYRAMAALASMLDNQQRGQPINQKQLH